MLNPPISPPSYSCGVCSLTSFTHRTFGLRRYQTTLALCTVPNLQVWALVEEAGQSAGLHPIRVCVCDIAICPCALELSTMTYS